MFTWQGAVTAAPAIGEAIFAPKRIFVLYINNLSFWPHIQAGRPA